MPLTMRRRNRSSREDTVGNGRALVFAALLSGVLVVVASPCALAAKTRALGHGGPLVGGGGDGRINRFAVRAGNGRFNRTSVVLSPSVNRGVQQIGNTTVGGRANTQSAVCIKRWRACVVRQSMGGW
ncbi:hypothetical protein [Actinoallomurus rhizosphaericola]|uniref:hypothetical protein n=1 Tax=Actinoallomurus rhizosphaericola TaxID=2952536 RepID=UPI0020927D4D|nr:hypothetical protein [Actinoallomurus rhizosphaericola]MCO5995910.1 hypothetical protein [Actinoallomurus rhizosphaericola]